MKRINLKSLTLKTLMTLTVLAGLVAAAPAHAQVHAVAQPDAPGEARDWKLQDARELTESLLRMKARSRYMGTFSDRDARTARLFDEVEASLNAHVPGGPHRVERVQLEDASVVLQARLAGEARSVTLIANGASDARGARMAGEGSGASPATGTGFNETLGLVIVDTTTFQRAGGMRFTQISESWDGSFKNAEAGIRRGRFNLSIFARQFGGDGGAGSPDYQAGVALTVPVVKVGGFALNARLEASEFISQRVDVTEGRVSREHVGATNAMLRLEATRTFVASGVTASGGVKFIYFGSNGLDQESLKIAFLSLGKQFRNRAGQPVVDARIMATHQLGTSRNEWMIAFAVGFKF